MNNEENTTRNWYATKAAGNGQGLVIDGDTGETVAVAYDMKDTPLLAAAPIMLEALKEIIDITGTRDPDWSLSALLSLARQKARDAINYSNLEDV